MAHAKKLLIIRPGALGDTLMLMPALAALAGKVAVTLVGRQPGIEFVRPFTHEAFDMERGGWHRLFADAVSEGSLQATGADLVTAFFRDEEGNLRRRLEQHFPGVSVNVFPSYPGPDRPVHEARHLAGCLASAGAPIDPEEAVASAERAPLFLTGTPPDRDPYMVLHPGSGSRNKNHPAEFWLQLGAILRDAFSGAIRPLYLLGPAEEHLFSLFQGAAGRDLIFCPEKDALLSLLANASLYIGHDSGPTHAAAMSGTPTFALFKGTDLTLWRPLGPRVRVFEARWESRALKEEILQTAEAWWGEGRTSKRA